MYSSIELFSGAGGLALGLAAAGFHHEALLEWNIHACKTLQFNKNAGFQPLNTWNIIEGDASDFNFLSLDKPIDLVAGGPPCQPFSLGGKHKCYDDKRDMFPIAVKAVRELCPNAFVFENVKGLLRDAFTQYVSYLTLQLNYPDVIKYNNELWEEHLSRLEKRSLVNSDSAYEYRTLRHLMNAADYGVPQKRERVFIVGFRSDLGVEWKIPEKTHCEDALYWAKWITGEYWDEHRISKLERPEPTNRDKAHTNKICNKYGMFGPPFPRWRTVRDAIANLSDKSLNHETRRGARHYVGHTGSDIDEPAKALKAGDHGVPGGENMVRNQDNSVQYFSVRESCRIQTFPDDFYISGSWTEGMRQIGNAVPVKLAEAVGHSIHQHLDSALSKRKSVE